MKKRPIFRKILVPLMALVIIEILILVCTMFGQGLIHELNANEKAVIQSRVTARKNYLESVMVNNWMNVSNTVDYVVTAAQRLESVGMISRETLDDSSQSSAPLLEQTAARLIEMMRTNHVTGVYIILNTENLSGTMQSGVYADKPGVYLRDVDPTSLPSERNEDILIALSPMAVVKELGIATDTNWDLSFRFSEEMREFYDLLYYPFQTAYENQGEYSWKDMGYWSSPYGTDQSENMLISYSVPLILADGTVIGVLGVDLTYAYIQSLLPSEELDESESGSYFLAQYSEESGTFSHVFGSGNTEGLVSEDGENFAVNHEQYYSYMEPLQIYNSNTPFSSQQWVLAGIIPYESMQGFAKNLVIDVMMAVTAGLIIGMGVCLLISYRLQKPVARLAQEVKREDPGSKIRLSPTGILEIDQMSEAVEHLSQDVIESGKKFSRIIEMASVHLGGFQVDRSKNTLFLTEKFFAIFGCEEIQKQNMTVEEFKIAMDRFKPYFVERDVSVDGYVFRVPIAGKHRFVRVRVLEDGDSCYGLAEDVTQALLEKQILKHERDHDSLTNLYNRGAFRRKVQELFKDPKHGVGIGAFLMIDLDNLKYINDTYGHEYGDRYIRQAAVAMENSLSGNVCYARISGDEFNVFIYDAKDREGIEVQIRRLQEEMNSAFITLPDGKIQRVHATGGIAWYPDDSRSFDDLSKYADYAMYSVKRMRKGEFRNFEMSQFRSQDMLFRSSAALMRMIDNKVVHYAFQPIVDARTGKIFAYEALMRTDVEELSSVKDIMETARREGKLNQIEAITWFTALETFEEHIKQKRIEPDSCLFINSIPNQRMSMEQEAELLERFGKYGKQLIMELTEDEQMDSEIWEEKQRRHKAMGGRIALDDYGTGYNSEKTLLALSPDFIKVDMAIVHDIHINPDKRTIMEYIVNYAHERGKYIIAEGIEIREEVETILALGADYMQGFFFAKPQRIPEGISEESKKLLLELAQSRK